MPDEYVLIRQIQEFFGEGAKPIFGFFNTLWGLGIAQILPAIIFWLGGRKIGYRAGLFTDISGSAGTYAKWIFTDPRPFYVSDAFTPFKVSTGFGMPSGNAQGIASLMVSISIYGRRYWLWITAAVLIFFVGLARVYYGVHSPAQVVVGWLAGIAIALALFKFADPFVTWFHKRSFYFQASFVLGLSILVTLIGLVINQLVLQNFVVPEAWIERYNEIAVATDEEDPFSLFDPNDSYAIGAYLFGFGISGILLLRNLIPEIKTGRGKALNLFVGLLLLYAIRNSPGIIVKPLRETILFWPCLLLVLAAIPLVIYAVTPLVTARILAFTKSNRAN